MIYRKLIIADSNGAAVQLPGDSTMNPNNPVFAPFYTDAVNGAFKSFKVSEETTGIIFATIWRNNQQVSDPVLLHVGMVFNIAGDRIVPVGIRRAGEVWLELSDDAGVYDFTRGDVGVVSRGMQLNVFPLTQIPLYVGGPLSNVWCHPNSAPGSAAPMVMGTASRLAAGAIIGRAGYTAANWDAVYLAVFNVDPVTQSVVNVRRASGALSATNIAISINGFEFNPWDRVGMIAIPSATNPNPALAPATTFQCIIEGYSTYSRKVGFGYLGIGAGSELV